MTILLLAGSPSAPSRSTRLLHYTGERLALLGHRHQKLQVRDLPASPETWRVCAWKSWTPGLR